MMEDYSQNFSVRTRSSVTNTAFQEGKKEVQSKSTSSFGHIFSLKSLKKDIDDLRESDSLKKQIKLGVKIYAKVISAPVVFTAKVLIKASILIPKGIKKGVENAQKKFSDVINDKDKAESPKSSSRASMAPQSGKTPATIPEMQQKERKKSVLRDLDSSSEKIGSHSKTENKNVNEKALDSSNKVQETKSEKKGFFAKIFQKLNTINFNSAIDSNVQIPSIDSAFTQIKSIEEQRVAHAQAKKYLLANQKNLQADIAFVSPPPVKIPNSSEVVIKKDLNTAVFSWTATNGVQNDIQKDGKNKNQVVLYGIASQFNTCEAVDRFTPAPGTAVKTYATDKTQGPLAQLQFSDLQVETINNAANLGYNGLCNVLDEKTKTAVKHGYLTPVTEQQASDVIDQIQKNGSEIEYLCIGSIPKGEDNTEAVYGMMVSAPAFGIYSAGYSITDEKKYETAYSCAVVAYRSQFEAIIDMAKQNPDKQAVLKLTASGLGVFSNNPEAAAKGFYLAAKEYENLLEINKVKVEFQVFKGEGDAKILCDTVGLEKTK